MEEASPLEKLPLDEAVEKEVHLREGNISLILDSYDDIFSDFDPRPYAEKALSDDFLTECRKAARDKDEFELELRLLVPKQKRDFAEETKIKHRLKTHFHKHFLEKEREVRSIKLAGLKWFGAGAVFMLVSAYLYAHAETGFFTLTSKDFLFNLLVVFFEPAGWFSVWTGLDQIFFGAKEKQPELAFYRKMVGVHIEFYEYK